MMSLPTLHDVVGVAIVIDVVAAFELPMSWFIRFSQSSFARSSMTAIKAVSERGREQKKSILHKCSGIAFLRVAEAQRNRKIISSAAEQDRKFPSIDTFNCISSDKQFVPWHLRFAPWSYLLLIAARCVYYRYHKTPSLTPSPSEAF